MFCTFDDFAKRLPVRRDRRDAIAAPCPRSAPPLPDAQPTPHSDTDGETLQYLELLMRPA